MNVMTCRDILKNTVSELQRDALDKEFDLESLLRKAYIISTKIKSLDFEKWVQCEQNGYDDNIPEYRRIEGKLVGVNFRNGEFEVIFSDRDMEKGFTTIKLPNKISELYALYNEAQEGKLAMECTPYNNKELSEACGEECRFRLEFSKIQLYSIFQSVRNNILKWSLTLMQNKGVEVMTKDAQKLLKHIIDESKSQNSTTVEVDISRIKNIPNIEFAKKKLLNELEVAGVISGYQANILGEVFVYLTSDGLEYFDDLRENKEASNIVFNVSGGQVNIANDKGSINAVINDKLCEKDTILESESKENNKVSLSSNKKTEKVFISYSWTPECNKKWVEQLVHKLESDGVEVVIDFKDLKLGHDKYAFMERAVNDNTIKKVLIICNRTYKEKADGRIGGVGDESAIITSQVYGNVRQEKFIPVVNELDENGRPFLPNYLASRMYADLTDFEIGYKILLGNIIKSQIVNDISADWEMKENIDGEFRGTEDIKIYEDLFNPENLLNDDTQKILLPYIKETKELFEKTIKEYDSQRSEFLIFPSLDLGFPNNVQRLAGGFATGMLVMWKCGTPIIPVDATVNVCSSSVFEIDNFNTDMEDDDFKKYIEYIMFKATRGNGYSFSFDSGNHFLMIAQDINSKQLYLVLHSSANGFKNSYIGLYPVEDNWYSDYIRVAFGSNARYIRFIKDYSAVHFIENAHKLEKYNVQIHKWFADYISNNNSSTKGKTFHHYYMPTDSSIAIGTYVEEPNKIVPLFSDVGKDIYMFKIGKDNWKIRLGGREVCLVPHGWGQVIDNVKSVVVDNENKILRIDNYEYTIDSKSRIQNGINKHVRKFKDGEEFLEKGKAMIKGEIVQTLRPIYLYCSKAKGKVNEIIR